MKIVYIGADSPLSWKPLKALLRFCQSDSANAEFEISAIASSHFTGDVEEDKNTLTTMIPIIDTRSDTLQSLAFQNNIAFFKIQQDISKLAARIQPFQPDIILVSCFAHRLPDAILSIAHIGCFNLHPSLLPQYRGPDPLFWQFRAEKCEYGVSLHRMTAELDSGNILLQKPLVMPDGCSQLEAIHLLAHAAGEIMLRSVKELFHGTVAELPQQSAHSSYQPFPTAKDAIISHHWAARRMYNFINAYEQDTYQQVGHYFECRINKQTFQITKALSYQSQPYPDTQHLSQTAIAYEINPLTATITIACSSGFIRCKLFT